MTATVVRVTPEWLARREPADAAARSASSPSASRVTSPRPAAS